MQKKPLTAESASRPFWQRLLIILGIDSVVVLGAAFLFHNITQISNFYFLSSIVFFIIAVIPIAGEIGGSAKIAGRAIRKGENVSEQLKGKQQIYEMSAKTTYLFGSAGLITFLLSIVLLSLG